MNGRPANKSRMTEIVEKFYQAFARRDWQGMVACYHDDVVFSDPVFPNLRGREAKAMWQMLVTSGTDLVVNFKPPVPDENGIACDWEAFYTFSATGRKVHNVIHAHLEFSEGKIIRHRDTFDLWRWTRMALGTPGVLMGWTPLLQGRVRGIAAARLAKFLEKMAQNP